MKSGIYPIIKILYFIFIILTLPKTAHPQDLPLKTNLLFPVDGNYFSTLLIDYNIENRSFIFAQNKECIDRPNINCREYSRLETAFISDKINVLRDLKATPDEFGVELEKTNEKFLQIIELYRKTEGQKTYNDEIVINNFGVFKTEYSNSILLTPYFQCEQSLIKNDGTVIWKNDCGTGFTYNVFYQKNISTKNLEIYIDTRSCGTSQCSGVLEVLTLVND